MGASVSQGGHRRRKPGGFRPMSEINVTPFVDVMLVLLVIFIITAPLLTVGVPIDLPQSKARALPEDSKPLEVTVDSKGVVYLQASEVAIEDLAAKLQAIAENRMDTRIYVRGDQAIAYGKVIEVMGTISSAGFTKVALVTEPARSAPKRK